MVNMWISKSDGKFRVKTRVVLGALVVVIVAGLGLVPHRAFGQTSDSSPSDQISFLDPFSLNVISLVVPGARSNAAVPTAVNRGRSVTAPGRTSDPFAGNALLTRPPIRMPCRPPIASPSRPPWVPDPPSWWPGPPPWNP